MNFGILLLLIFSFINCQAQTFSIKGSLSDSTSGKGLPYSHVYLNDPRYYSISDSSGSYEIKNVPAGSYTISVSMMGYDTISRKITVTGNTAQDFSMAPSASNENLVVIKDKKTPTFGIRRLNDIEGTSIYAGKKNEVIVMKDISANTATNNSRQIYSKVPGLNIWESDGAGIQLGIGGRGLNPNRTSNFNTRQNGYDISADALGYPESYYSPPAEAIERIEIVRGAASLQYGTQFGGFINFRLKKGTSAKPFEFLSRQTFGSFGFFNSFNSIGGTKKKINYYVYYQHKQGNEWRPNSGFNVNAAYAAVTYQASDKLSVTGEYTFMDYLAQQPGGLTDKMFDQDPQQSLRTRNWFKVNWNLMALYADYKFSPQLKFNTRFFSLMAGRSALGLLIAPNRADPMTQRDLWLDQYRNWGNESRLLYTYATGENVSGFLFGFRYYNGFTDRKQGFGNAGSTGKASDFAFVNPGDLEYSQYSFPSHNIAVFAENVFRLSSKLSITPGLRFENIQTNARGFYNQINTDLAGNIIFKQRVDEDRSADRSFLLSGIGIGYELSKSLDMYANISQNYRSINFNDMRVVNPNLRVDPDLKDEKGFTFDAGMRGNISNILNYDFSLFMIRYNNRIGSVLKTDTATFNVYRLRTNISESRNIGFESFAELNFWHLLKGDSAKARISVFTNFSLIDARYINSQEAAFENKKVELVPDIILKTGITYKLGQFSGTYQYSYTGAQYTDATNTEFTSNAVNGLIKAYYVMDLTLQYSYKNYSISGSVNNLSNRIYFTRRADAYPGPGIIPAAPRTFYISVGAKF
jgi:Fe(3+) dicitrate transport protein